MNQNRQFQINALGSQGVGVVKSAPIVPIKVGWYGPQGSGKTTSAALLSLALSKEIYNGAPVFVTDTEPGWQFLKPIFAIEGVELIQRTEPTFKAMTQNQREAERLGACVWNVDTLTIIWAELMQSFKARNHGFIPIEKWGDIREMWNKDYVAFFLNTKMCCQALGRLGNVTDEIQDENNPEKTKLVKMGTRFKAGGSEDFGYEPHLLLEVSTERKAKVKAGSRLEGEGRIVHRVDVLKDRTWALNGKVIRWSDKPKYEKGGYRQVWESIKPHWLAVQQTAHVQIRTEASSQELIAVSGDSQYAERMKRLAIVLEEIDGTMRKLWPGQEKLEKIMRLEVAEALFSTRSWEAVKAMRLEDLEDALKLFYAFEAAAKADAKLLTEKEAALAKIAELRHPAPLVPVVENTVVSRSRNPLDDPDLISNRETQLLLSLAKRLGWTEPVLASALVSEKGIVFNAIPVDNYESVVEFIEQGPPEVKRIVLEGALPR